MHDRSKCACMRDQSQRGKPDALGMAHVKPGSIELEAADASLARAALSSGRISMVFTKVTDKSGRGFLPPNDEAAAAQRSV